MESSDVWVFIGNAARELDGTGSEQNDNRMITRYRDVPSPFHLKRRNVKYAAEEFGADLLRGDCKLRD